MKHFLYIFCCLFGLFPSLLKAEGHGSILMEVSRAVIEEKWDEAGKLFCAAIAENKEEAENFFWRENNMNVSFRKTMALELGNFYKKQHNRERAYLFYSELIKLEPANVSYLSSLAELGVCCGKEKEALDVYEKVLNIDKDNLAANIYAGNYYFFYAEKTKKKIEEDYAKILMPTRMQSASYQNKLFNLLNTEYIKSKQHLEKVMTLFPSTEVQKTLDKIKAVEIEIRK